MSSSLIKYKSEEFLIELLMRSVREKFRFNFYYKRWKKTLLSSTGYSSTLNSFSLLFSPNALSFRSN